MPNGESKYIIGELRGELVGIKGDIVELKNDVKDIKEDIRNLRAWRFKVAGVFSVIAFLISLIAYKIAEFFGL